ncbi:MAG: hypothetical protein MI922_28150, partial [Bacteroidales bacterium]|nr:hypothetical protein [Bacteroidales bacterium]
MKEINQIKEALKNIVEVPVQTFEAVVEEVDEELATCIVLIGTLTISDIRLRSVIDEGYGFYFVPK